MSDPIVKTAILVLLEILILLFLVYLGTRVHRVIKTGQIEDYVNRLLASSGGYMISSDGIGKFQTVDQKKTPIRFYINLFLVLVLCTLVIATGISLPYIYQQL